MKMGSETYHPLQGVIKKKYGLDATAIGDEGGFAPNVQDNFEGLNLLVDAIEKAGYTGKIKICMDVASSEFYKDGLYDLDFKNPNRYVSCECPFLARPPLCLLLAVYVSSACAFRWPGAPSAERWPFRETRRASLHAAVSS